jgi:hypothetical protein
MATRKHKPAAGPVDRAIPSRPSVRLTETVAATTTLQAASPQRFLREAAWSRMFGRTEAKNPFASSR